MGNYYLCGILTDYSREIVGAALGLILGWIAWIVLQLRIRLLNWMYYDEYNGKYDVYLKSSSYEDLQYRIQIDVSNNKFKIAGTAFKNGKIEAVIIGEIEMDKSIPKYGRGYYRHDKSDWRQVKFGFYEIQLDYGNILVHQNIKGIDESGMGIDRSAAYIWIKRKED